MSQDEASHSMRDTTPRVLSNEEIEMYLKGDRREVDRLILLSLNRLAACIIPHAEREEARDAASDRLLKSLGGTENMVARATYVDTMITRNETRTRMMEKVSQSSITWALIVFFGFLATAAYQAVVTAIKAKMGA